MWVTSKIFAGILYRPFKPVFIVISILYCSFILFDHKLSAVYNDYLYLYGVPFYCMLHVLHVACVLSYFTVR